LRTGLGCSPPHLLPPPPSSAPSPIYGPGQVHSKTDTSDKNLEELHGGTPLMEGPRGRHLLPPLWLGTRIFRTRNPHMPLWRGRSRTSPPRRHGCRSRGPPLVLSPSTKKARHLHQRHLHQLPPNDVPAHHAPLFPALPPLSPQPAAPRVPSVFLG